MIETADTDYAADHERPIVSRYLERKSEEISIWRKNFPTPFF